LRLLSDLVEHVCEPIQAVFELGIDASHALGLLAHHLPHFGQIAKHAVEVLHHRFENFVIRWFVAHDCVLRWLVVGGVAVLGAWL